MDLDSPVDEIKQHLQARYLSPCEAVWRLVEFRMHEEFPPVTHLAVHEPGKQPVYFPDDATTQQVREKMETARTTLMAFFVYNRLHPNGPKYLYSEAPQHLVFDAKAKAWKPR